MKGFYLKDQPGALGLGISTHVRLEQLFGQLENKMITTHHVNMPKGLNEDLTVEADPRDEKNGGASHSYVIVHERVDAQGNESSNIGLRVAKIQFQHGPRNEEGSTAGCSDASILAVLIDRYRGWQKGEFRCRENAIILTHMEEALLWMKERERERHQRGVLGKLEA